MKQLIKLSENSRGGEVLKCILLYILYIIYLYAWTHGFILVLRFLINPLKFLSVKNPSQLTYTSPSWYNIPKGNVQPKHNQQLTKEEYMSNVPTLQPALNDKQLTLIEYMLSDGFAGVDYSAWGDPAFLDRNGYRIVVFKNRMTESDVSNVVEAGEFEIEDSILVQFKDATNTTEAQRLLIMQPSDDVQSVSTIADLLSILNDAMGFEIPHSNTPTLSTDTTTVYDASLPVTTLNRGEYYESMPDDCSAGQWFSKAYVSEFLKPWDGLYYDGHVLFIDRTVHDPEDTTLEEAMQDFIDDDDTDVLSGFGDLSYELYFNKEYADGLLQHYAYTLEHYEGATYSNILTAFTDYCMSNVVMNSGAGQYIKSDSNYFMFVPAMCVFYAQMLLWGRFDDEELDARADMALAAFPETCAYIDSIYEEVAAAATDEVIVAMCQSAYDMYNTEDFTKAWAIFTIYPADTEEGDIYEFLDWYMPYTVPAWSYCKAPEVFGSRWALLGSSPDDDDDPEPGPDDNTDNFTVAVTINGLRPFKAMKRVQVAAVIDFDELETNRNIHPWKFR